VGRDGGMSALVGDKVLYFFGSSPKRVGLMGGGEASESLGRKGIRH